MKAISVLIVICLLTGCAHGQFYKSHGKQYGPPWSVWTHSDKKEWCMAKTVFWFVLGTAALGYVIYRVDKYYKEKRDPEKEGD